MKMIVVEIHEERKGIDSEREIGSVLGLLFYFNLFYYLGLLLQEVCSYNEVKASLKQVLRCEPSSVTSRLFKTAGQTN